MALMKLLKPDNEPSHHTTLELFAKKPQLVGLCEIFDFFLSVPLTLSPWKFCQKTLFFTSGAFFCALSSQKEVNPPPNCFLQSQALCWLLFLMLKYGFQSLLFSSNFGGQKCLTVSDYYVFCTWTCKCEQSRGVWWHAPLGKFQI